MRFINKKFTKASFAFLCFTCLCGFFNYQTLTWVPASEPVGTIGALWHFSLYFFQVAAALVTIYYGERLMRVRENDKEWHYAAVMTPEKETRLEESKVIFITVDGCLFNGIYNARDGMFYAYDGLDFPPCEVSVWTLQTVSLVFEDCAFLKEDNECNGTHL